MACYHCNAGDANIEWRVDELGNPEPTCICCGRCQVLPIPMKYVGRRREYALEQIGKTKHTDETP